jgi:putative FmdB family regulatory protein
MPHYNYFCHACKKTFSKVLTLAEYEEDEGLCPHRDSDNVEQSWTVF